MLDGRFLGPLLLLGGSGFLIFPGILDPMLQSHDAGLAGLAVMALGCSLSLLAWRIEDRQGSSGSPIRPLVMWNRISGSVVQHGPAKRMKIRIRCAR